MGCSSYELYNENNIITCNTREFPIQSITFEVESNLAKPKRFLFYKRIDKILNSIFVRQKQNLDSIDKFNISYKEIDKFNEIMEILCSSFDTDKKEFYNYGKKSLFRGLMEAYANHYPITISPNMILILFFQGIFKIYGKTF